MDTVYDGASPTRTWSGTTPTNGGLDGVDPISTYLLDYCGRDIMGAWVTRAVRITYSPPCVCMEYPEGEHYVGSLAQHAITASRHVSIFVSLRRGKSYGQSIVSDAQARLSAHVAPSQIDSSQPNPSLATPSMDCQRTAKR